MSSSFVTTFVRHSPLRLHAAFNGNLLSTSEIMVKKQAAYFLGPPYIRARVTLWLVATT